MSEFVGMSYDFDNNVNLLKYQDGTETRTVVCERPAKPGILKMDYLGEKKAQSEIWLSNNPQWKTRRE